MGLRGPGAKPIKRKSNLPDVIEVKPVASWAKPGLSRAQRLIRWAEFELTITAGAHAGRSFKFRPWQKAIITGLYRTDRKGKRLVRQALFTVPRKNGKTQLAAVLALAHLCGPEAEQRGQVFSAAADREQAAIIFREMVAMIQANPGLSDRVIVRDFSKTLEDAETGSTYKALSSDSRTKHGLSASFVVYDELAQAPNRELYDVLATSTAARAEPLMLTISTQSSDPLHIMSELVDYGQQVLDGVIADPAFYACIYAAPDDADPWDEEVWKACNPALGDFRSLEEMRSFAAQAKRIPAKEAAFRALYLNQRIDPDQHFLAGADWDACNGAVDLEALQGRPCWAGLDLSATTDLTSLVLFFPEDGGAVVPFFWMPADTLQDREDRDRAPYVLWKRQGLLEALPGRAIDKKIIARRMAELATRYNIRGISYDRWGTKELKRIMDEEGIGLPLVEFGQGFKDFSPAVSALEVLVLGGKLRHGGHPLLRWCVSNIKVAIDPAGGRKFDKSKATKRIDGAVALAMAVGAHAREPGPKEFVDHGISRVISF